MSAAPSFCQTVSLDCEYPSKNYGMNELQASLAVGTSANAGSGEIGSRTMEYSNNSKPVTVTFENNKAVSVTPVKAQ
ncbi:MAG: hypothetical protein DMG65_00990 [Candidatus Angelobacter sp. Gp1-AA117]|nr:MAG: hypothetical protein DMG65_00990 [Candidatus Angelobacter sp. Gp1-AA117]